MYAVHITPDSIVVAALPCGSIIELLHLLSHRKTESLMLLIKQIHATTRPDSVASLESGKAAIDATTIMAIRLGGACLEVLYANDGELLKQYMRGCSGALLNEVLGVSDSHRQIMSPHSHRTLTPAPDRR